MWKLLGRIFGSEKVIDSGISGIDKVFYTNEEKADYHLKFLSAYEPFKLAQRYLAILFSIVFLFVFLMAAIIMAIGGIIESPALVETCANLIALETDILGWPIVTIVAFYFAGGTVNSIRQMKGRVDKPEKTNSASTADAPEEDGRKKRRQK